MLTLVLVKTLPKLNHLMCMLGVNLHEFLTRYNIQATRNVLYFYWLECHLKFGLRTVLQMFFFNFFFQFFFYIYIFLSEELDRQDKNESAVFTYKFGHLL